MTMKSMVVTVQHCLLRNDRYSQWLLSLEDSVKHSHNLVVEHKVVAPEVALWDSCQPLSKEMIEFQSNFENGIAILNS